MHANQINQKPKTKTNELIYAALSTHYQTKPKCMQAPGESGTSRSDARRARRDRTGRDVRSTRAHSRDARETTASRRGEARTSWLMREKEPERRRAARNSF